VAFHGGENFLGAFQGGQALFGADFGGEGPVADGAEEGLLLEADGLLVVDLELLDVEQVGPIHGRQIEVAALALLLDPLDDVHIGGGLDHDPALLEIIDAQIGLPAEN